MKKYLATILALVMVFAMAFSLVGCGADKDSIDGDWEGTFSGDYMGMDIECGVEVTFEDGEYTMTIDKDDIADAIKGSFEALAEEMDYDIDELLEAEGYDDIDEYIDEYLDEIDEDDLTSDGKYKFDAEDEELKIDGEEVDYEFDGDTLEFEFEGMKLELER